MHQKMERMSQGARFHASAAPPVKRNETSAQQESRLQKSGYSSELFRSQVQWVKTFIKVMLFFLSETFLLQAWGQVLLFNLEGRGMNAYSTLPKSRLLNYYFLDFKDRSQWTRPAPLVKVGLKSPWVGATVSTKVSMSICPFISSSNLIQISSSVSDTGWRFGLSLELD